MPFLFGKAQLKIVSGKVDIFTLFWISLFSVKSFISFFISFFKYTLNSLYKQKSSLHIYFIYFTRTRIISINTNTNTNTNNKKYK